ncbi:hypothetical protein LTR37_004272 [Vermiconidia calcicola]|uniref:Uncharacterized protein n=1 Tax=Vermiconidia calcicola TaxID=1690605 RepID=A0ACC3NN90_9PEZI|nr:hypothetical protein LTR37_004272 [Vermiconidia calcicola]
MVTQILRLKRTDKPDQHLLINVSQTSSRPLDLKFIGTEYEHLYHASVKESNVKALQTSNYGGDLNEWKEVLRYALQRERPQDHLPDPLQGLETVAAISGKTLTVTLRKNIGGITQRLGAIKLDQDDEREEVSAFDWVDTAVSHADELSGQLETLQASVSGQQEQVVQLTKQLDDLVKAKKEHEDELLKKFVALLNAKKLKIRDQQRLLNGAQVDPAAAEAVGASRAGTSRTRKAKTSRNGKRKVDEAEDGRDDDEMEEDGDMPEALKDYDEERQEEETPPRSDGEETDDEGLNLDAPASSRPGRTKTNGAMEADEPAEPPPIRDLPFARKSAQRVEQAPAPVEDRRDEDDEETDDEL